MTCLLCSNVPKRSTDERRNATVRSMARAGFVSCGITQAGATFKPFTSTCKSFTPADEKAAEARRAWASAMVPRETIAGYNGAAPATGEAQVLRLSACEPVRVE